jgi:hypothetical protein
MGPAFERKGHQELLLSALPEPHQQSLAERLRDLSLQFARHRHDDLKWLFIAQELPNSGGSTQ